MDGWHHCCAGAAAQPFERRKPAGCDCGCGCTSGRGGWRSGESEGGVEGEVVGWELRAWEEAFQAHLILSGQLEHLVRVTG